VTAAGDILNGRMGGATRRVAQGSWSLELRGDEIADISFDGVYLLRAVRPVVRDRDWNTVPVSVLSQQLTGSDDGAVLTHLRFAAADIAYAASTKVQLRNNELTVNFDGRALADFHRNRIGLVVLHPAADAGRAVWAKHSDGSVTAGSWPTEISPHQPFRDVVGLEWSKDGLTASLSFVGDIFETEDQRNWTDASFKTYSTPLDLPFPVLVRAGSTCHQAVHLTVVGRRSTGMSAQRVRDMVTISPSTSGQLPPISLGASLYPSPADLPGIAPFYESVLVELTGDLRRWPEHLRSAAQQAGVLGTKLDVRIVTADTDVVRQCVLQLAGLPVLRLGVFDPHSHVSTPPLWEALREAARKQRLGVQLVGGTRAHFTELNRQIQQIPSDVPTLSFSITPQMHATEIPHILDSLPMQRVVAENARRLAGERPVLVGPITLARRFNAVATTDPHDPAVEAQRAIDPLQPTDFTAAWTLASVASLTAAGVAGICYFETHGPRGIATSEGTLTPAGRTLNTVARLRGRPVRHWAGPHDVAALAVAPESGPLELFLANLSAKPRTVTVDGWRPHSRRVDLDGWSVTHIE
jgi:D-apionolactonase